MDVRCEKCATEYELDETKLKSSGVTVKCTNCGHMFKVRKRASGEEGAAGGKLRTWLVRMTDGEIKACYELSTLQQWIAAGHVTRECQISRTGKKWKRLGEIAELSSFFEIAEDAKREAAEKRKETAADAGKRGVAHPHTMRREASQSRPLPKPVTGSHGVGEPSPKRTMIGQPAPVPPRGATERLPDANEPSTTDETVPVQWQTARDTEKNRAESEEETTKSYDGPAVAGEAASARADSVADDGPTKKFNPDQHSAGFPDEEDAPTKSFSPDAPENRTAATAADASDSAPVRDSKKTAVAKKISTPPSSIEDSVSRSGETESQTPKTGGWAANAAKAAARVSEKDAPKTGGWAAQSAKGARPTSDSDGPSFSGIKKAARDEDAAFVGGKVGPIADDDDGGYAEDYAARSGGGGGKWIAIGSVVVLAAAGVVLYLTLFAGGDKKQAANEKGDAAVPAVTRVGDAGVAETPTVDTQKSALESAKQALLLDSPAALELTKEALAKDTQDESAARRVIEARVLLALAQHVLDRPAASKAEAKKRDTEVRKLAADAASMLEKARASDATLVSAMVATADALRLQEGATREVERWLRKALTAEKDNREALYVRALLHIRNKQNRDARAILSELVDDSVPDTRPRYRLAMLDFDDQAFDASKSGAESVLQVAKEHAGAQELLARIAKAQTVSKADDMPPETSGGTKAGGNTTTTTGSGNSEPASDSYASLIKKANQTAEVGNCASAIELFRQALDKNPTGVAALTGLGYCHTDRREFAQAQAKFRAALGISPRDAGALYGVAEAYQQQGLAPNAIAAYKKYLAVHPSGSRAASAKKQIERLGGSLSGGTGGDDGDDDDDPVDKPPVDKPPVDKPPGDTPPGDTPPGDTPPGDTPPGDTPPGDKVPNDKPPVDKPPADTPPADKPPADKPPADKPPATPPVTP